MLLGILGFEWRYQLRNPVFWVAVTVFFLMAFGATTVDQIQIGSGGNVHKNAPFAIAQMMLVLSLFYMFVSTAFVANVVVRDDETGFAPILRATRITRGAYLFGRFGGAFGAAALGFLAVPLGVWLGSLMPWVDAETLGPNRLWYYLQPYLVVALPDLFLTAALFFALATLTRSMMATYVGVIAFLVLWTVATVVLDRNPAWEMWGAYGEPLGFGAISLLTKYWTAADRNTLTVPVEGVLLVNRLLAAGLGAAVLALAFATFRFAARPSRKARRAEKLATRADAEPAVARPAGPLPMPRFDRATAWAQLAARTRLEVGQVLKSPAYPVLLALGLFNSGGALLNMGEIFGTPVLPVTRVVIRLLDGSFGIIPLIVAIYYAGELVWRERDRRTHEIVDASAIPDWAFVVPKALAVVLVMFSTLLVSAAGAMAVQLFQGYSDLEPGKYLLWYVLPNTVDYALIAILAVLVQALSPHKFVGWGVTVLYMIVVRTTLRNLGWGDLLYDYAATPDVPLSDMNGQGGFWVGAWWLRLYWSAFAVGLLVLAHALWRRGAETRLSPRLRRLPRRLAGPAGAVGAGALAVFAATGAWAYLNTHVWNPYRTSVGDDRFLADYERALLPYERVPQPRVTAVRVAVDIRPGGPAMSAAGTMRLVNDTGRPLDRIHVRMGDRRTRLVALDLPGATLERAWPRFQYRIYRLATPMAPGAALDMRFRTERRQRGFANTPDTRVVANGTFVNNGEFAPAVGMNRLNLLGDRVKRRRYGLPSELRPPKLEDASGTRASMFHAGWVTTDITVSTDADQTPVAPGDRVSDTVRAGRRTARFVTRAPILDFYSVQSARYAERHRRHGNVDLAVYYDARHGANVDRMLSAFAHGLDLYQPAFGPYQFAQARIVEFPDYAQFAQAFAGTMPYSEGIGFIADLSDPEKIDYVTYVAAHELAHQWWAHQAITSDNQGATFGIETMAQYSALMVMERLYGRDRIRRFLKFELDRYLRSRGGDPLEELPLNRVENQQYIHYRKGSVAMYRLKDELGEARVDAALKRYVTRFRFKGAPYPRSLDLVAEFRRGATVSENALITDLFERITLYDIKARAAAVSRLPDGRWRTRLTVEARKLYADGRGVEREAPMAETVEVGAFAAMPGRGAFAAKDVLGLKRVPVRSGTQVVELVTAARPVFAGADPYNVRIDRNSDDNLVATTGG